MSQLFTPISLGELDLPNRIIIAPMCQYSADEGKATEWHTMHLGQLSLSGAGLLDRRGHFSGARRAHHASRSRSVGRGYRTGAGAGGAGSEKTRLHAIRHSTLPRRAQGLLRYSLGGRWATQRRTRGLANLLSLHRALRIARCPPRGHEPGRHRAVESAVCCGGKTCRPPGL